MNGECLGKKLQEVHIVSTFVTAVLEHTVSKQIKLYNLLTSISGYKNETRSANVLQVLFSGRVCWTEETVEITNCPFSFCRFRPLSKQAELKKVVEEFIHDQDYEKAHDSLLSMDPRRVAPLIKTEREQSLMRQHVRYFLIFMPCYIASLKQFKT